MSGHIAVARLTQGISPKHCNSPARRAEGVGDMSNLHKPFVWSRHLKPGLLTAARSAACSQALSHSEGDEKCLAITGLTAPPLSTSPLVQVSRQTRMITPRRQRKTLTTLSLCNKAGRGSLPIAPNQKDIGMKSDRPLFQILHKRIPNTSGATKDRSMTEKIAMTAGHCPQNLTESQTGINFGLRRSQQ
jgi:hypothetical protein